MKPWDADLSMLDLDAIRPVFDPLDGVQSDARRKLSTSRSHHTRTLRRRTLDLRQQTDAATAIGRLPTAGETVHIVCDGSYKSWHHIPAVSAAIAPAAIGYLGIFTLSFSADNIADLCEMLDSGQVRALDLCYSCYFKSIERGACERQTAQLVHRGARVASFRTHAKILLIETTTGDAYVIETSANLRSAGNLEQSALTNDGGLLAFYRSVLDELLSRVEE
jgi:hypothetical protein